jgi:translation initiation factor 3 subunit B
MADEDYYKQLEDFDDIKEYLLELTDEFVAPEFPPFSPDFSTAIIVDNLPNIGLEKIPKLMQVLMKIYGQVSEGIQESDIYMPFNEATALTHGFCSIKFTSNELAESAIKITQGFAIDKKHSFKVSLYSDLDKYSSISDEYVPPEAGDFKPRPDPTSWLTDSQCRDQFTIRYGHETEISWANHTGEDPSVVYAGEREKAGGKVWCESYVSWSPQGTYLATFHTQGIKLWGSNEFESQGRFMHSDVALMDFSPCESYMVTYRYATNNSSFNPDEAIIVWDVRTGAKIRTFKLKNPLDENFQVQAVVYEEKAGKKEKVERVMRGRVVKYEGDSNGGSFEILEGNVTHKDIASDLVKAVQEPNRLKWSADGKYLARLGCDIIQVYELPSMTLLDKKSIAAKDVLDFTWSPRSNMISYWSPAVGNHPALINIIKLPERLDICSRKLFDVSDGRMVWQNDGDFLCVYMTKIQGKKKTYVLMFFRVLETEVPVEQLELSEPILSVTWEPSGDRVAIVHGEIRTPTVSFYSMSGVTTKASATGIKKREFTQLFALNGVQCNDVIWSPAGGVVALTYYAPDSCVFELHDVENNVSLATRRHDRGNKLVWDPTGRYIASCTIIPLRNANARGQTDDGFNLYTFQGTPLCQVKKDKLFQFNWRPRPKDLLLPEEKKRVIKNLKKYEKVFDKEDRFRKQELHAEVMATRHNMASEFMARLNRNIAGNALLKKRRVEIRNGYDSDDDRNYNVDVQVFPCNLSYFILSLIFEYDSDASLYITFDSLILYHFLYFLIG